MYNISLPTEREAVEARLSLGELTVEIMIEHTKDERARRNREARKGSVEKVLKTELKSKVTGIGQSNVCPTHWLNIPLYVTDITTYIYTELAPKLSATASVAQSVERWSRDPGNWSRLGLKVYIFLTLEFILILYLFSVI